MFCTRPVELLALPLACAMVSFKEPAIFNLQSIVGTMDTTPKLKFRSIAILKLHPPTSLG